MSIDRLRGLVVVIVAGLILAPGSPALAQLNNQGVQQRLERQIRNAPPPANAPSTTAPQASPAANQARTPVRVEGKVVSLQGDLLTLDQAVTVSGKVTTVRNRLYMARDTRVPSAGWKPTPAARVKVLYVVESDGRRRIIEIGP